MTRIAHGVAIWNGKPPRHHIQHITSNKDVIITSDKRTSAIWTRNADNVLSCQSFIVRKARSNAALASYPPAALNSSFDDVTKAPHILIGICQTRDGIVRIWRDGLIEQWEHQMERCISTIQLDLSTHPHINQHQTIKPFVNPALSKSHYLCYSDHDNQLYVLNDRFESIICLSHPSCIMSVTNTTHALLVLCVDGVVHSWPIRSISAITPDLMIDVNHSITSPIPVDPRVDITSDACHIATSSDGSMALITLPNRITILHVDKLTMHSFVSIQSSVRSAVWLDNQIVMSFFDSSIHTYQITSSLQLINQSNPAKTNSPFLLHLMHDSYIVGGNNDGVVLRLSSNVEECDTMLFQLADSFHPQQRRDDAKDTEPATKITMSALVIDSSSPSHHRQTSPTSLSITLIQTHPNNQITFSPTIRSSNKQSHTVVDSPHYMPITVLVCYHSWETSLGHSVVVSGTTDGMICVWDSHTATLLKSIRLPCPILNVHRLLNEHIDRDSRAATIPVNLLAIACSDQSLRLVTLPDLQLCSVLRGHTGLIELVFVPSFDVESDVICSLTNEGLLYTWSLIDGSMIDVIDNPEAERVLPLLLPDHVNRVREICTSTFPSPAVSPRNGTPLTQSPYQSEPKILSPSNIKSPLLAGSFPLHSSSSPPQQSLLTTPPNRNWSLKQIVKRSSTGWLSKNIDNLLNKQSRQSNGTIAVHEDSSRWSSGDERHEPLVQLLFSSPELHVSAFSLAIPAWIELIKREYVSPHTTTAPECPQPFVLLIRGLLAAMFTDASERTKSLLTNSFGCGSHFRSDGNFAYTTHESLVLLTPVSLRTTSSTVQAIRAVTATSVLFTLLSVTDPSSLPCFAAIEADIHSTAADQHNLPNIHLLIYFAFHSDPSVSQASLLLLKDRMSKLSVDESSALVAHYSETISTSLGAATPYAPGRTLSLSNQSPSSRTSLSTNSFTSTNLRHSDGGDLAVHFASSTSTIDELMSCLFLAQFFARNARSEPHTRSPITSDSSNRVDGDKEQRCFDETYSLKMSVSRVLLGALHSFDPWSMPSIDAPDVDSNSPSTMRIVLELLHMEVIRVFDVDLTPDSEVESCVFDVLSILNAQTDLTHLATKLLSHITCQRPNVVFAMLSSALSESNSVLLSLSTKKLCIITIIQAIRSLSWDLCSSGLVALLRCARDDADLFVAIREQLLQLIRMLMTRHQHCIVYHEQSHRLAFIIPSLGYIALYDMVTADRYRCLENSVLAQVIAFAPNGMKLASYHPSHAHPRSLHAVVRECRVLVWYCQAALPRNTNALIKTIDVPDHGSDAKLAWQANDVIKLQQGDISIQLHI